MIAQAPTVTLVTEGRAIWQDLLVASIPALVALAVVFIGGKQTRDRLEQQLREARDQWQDQRDFERQKYVMQERRTVYTQFLTSLDVLGYLTLHALGHLEEEQEHDDLDALDKVDGEDQQLHHHDHLRHDQEDAVQDWIEAHDGLRHLMTEVRLLGSEEFVAIVEEVDDFWDEWFERVLDLDPGAAAEWRSEPGQETSADWPMDRLLELHNQGVVQARLELTVVEVDHEAAA